MMQAVGSEIWRFPPSGTTQFFGTTPVFKVQVVPVLYTYSITLPCMIHIILWATRQTAGRLKTILSVEPNNILVGDKKTSNNKSPTLYNLPIVVWGITQYESLKSAQNINYCLLHWLINGPIVHHTEHGKYSELSQTLLLRYAKSFDR